MMTPGRKFDGDKIAAKTPLDLMVMMIQGILCTDNDNGAIDL